MSAARVFLVVILVGILAGCSGQSGDTKRILNSPIDSESELDPSADMGSYATWNWLPNPNLAALEAELKDPRVRSLIGAAVQSEMFMRGFRIDENSPDMIMNFHLATQRIDQDYINEAYDGTYLPDYRTDFEGSKNKAWDEGSIVFLIFDAKTGQMIWRGSAKAEVTDEKAMSQVTMQEREERINKVVKMMFKNLPKKK